MFILRCIFWLGLLFSAMPFSEAGRHTPVIAPGIGQTAALAPAAEVSPARAAQPVLANALHRTTIDAARHAAAGSGQLARSAATRLEEICLSAPRDCIAAAQRLQALFGDFSETASGSDTLRDADRALAPARR